MNIAWPIRMKRETRDIISSMPCPAVSAGPDGLVKAANTSFLDLLGYGGKEVVGKPLELFCKISGTELLELLERRGGTIRDMRADLVSKSGLKIPVSLSASLSDDGASGGLIASARDLRDELKRIDELEAHKKELLKRVSSLEEFREGVFHMLRDLDSHERELEGAYRKLKDTQEQLIQSGKMTALGELAAGIAHELNQPLTVIKGLSQSLLRDADPRSPQHEKLKLISESSRKMELVIRHLRIFSRTDEPDFAPVDPNSVIKDALLILKEIFLKNSIEIRMDLKEVPMVLGSPNRLEQVIVNLANNAKDAMPEGGTIEISSEPLDYKGLKFARIKMHDTGCGIPEEIIGRIFDPFFTTKAPGKGTGLGLSISYGIIKEHGGDITVESEPGKGTSFQITIPAIEGD